MHCWAWHDPEAQGSCGVQVSVQGDFGAKIVALLRRLIWLKEHEPDIKSLVSNRCSALMPRHRSIRGLDWLSATL